MVIDQLNVKGMIPLKAENDAPIGPYRHGPQPPQVAFEWGQTVAGEIQSLRRCCGIENREDSLNLIQEVVADPTSVAAFMEAFQAPMLKVVCARTIRPVPQGSRQARSCLSLHCETLRVT